MSIYRLSDRHQPTDPWRSVAFLCVGIVSKLLPFPKGESDLSSYLLCTNWEWRERKQLLFAYMLSRSE